MAYFAHPTAVIDDGAIIGDGCKIWHFCHVSAGARIGENCILGQGCFVAATAVIGNRVKIQNGVSVYDRVVIEDEVFCGPHMVFTNVINPRAFIERKIEYKQTLLKKGASIGAGAVIVCGNVIGEYAFVGAASVVTRNVPAYAVVYGNPARQRGWVDIKGYRLEFGESCRSTDEDGNIYSLCDNVVTLAGTAL